MNQSQSGISHDWAVTHILTFSKIAESNHQIVMNSTSLPSRLDSCLPDPIRTAQMIRIARRNNYSRGYSSVSKSIPIHSNSQRIQEEFEIRTQELLAEHRDFDMFVRLVSGMSQRTEHSSSVSCQSETDKSIASIVRTWHKKLGDESATESNDSEGFPDENHADRPPEAIFIIDM